MTLSEISDQLAKSLKDVTLSPPVSHVYLPLVYARSPHVAYLEKYGQKKPREVILVGMNPGPWGMAQTGVPFGTVSLVRDWLKIEAPVGKPEQEHPKRRVEGFLCKKEEVSGARLWGWAQKRFGTPKRFFERFFVVNYCPLLLLEADGKNRTPDKLKESEKNRVFDPCDTALRQIIDLFDPSFVIGIGAFAEQRVQNVAGHNSRIKIGRILHPSPANPAAGRHWAEQAETAMKELGIDLS